MGVFRLQAPPSCAPVFLRGQRSLRSRRGLVRTDVMARAGAAVRAAGCWRAMWQNRGSPHTRSIRRASSSPL